MSVLLLCLHGWGGTKESFTELRQALKDTDIDILTPDLPGFGAEPDPSEPWSVDDYADWAQEWLKNYKLPTKNYKLYVLGHSHGGRIAIKLAARGTLRIEHLYLCAAAGIRHPRHFKSILGLTLAKSGKFFLSIPGLNVFQSLARKLLYKLVRVHDYERASSVMRQTMIRVSAEDLTPLLSQIKVPTDIFWGSSDRMTPVSDAHLIHERIAGSKLHVYPGTTHRIHRDRAREIAAVIRNHSL